MNSSTSYSSIQHRAAIDLLHWTARQDRSKFYRLLNVMGIEYVVAPPEEELAGPLVRLDIQDSPAMTQSAGLWHNPKSGPRAWVVHRSRYRTIPQRFSDLRRDLDDVLLSGDPRQAVDRCVVFDPSVKIPAYAAHAESRASAPDRPAEFCELRTDRDSQVVIHTQLNEPGFVVVRDAYAPGWTCKVQQANSVAQHVPVLRANRIMRAVALPAGTHTLTMEYRPRSVYWGAVISVVAWLSTMIGCLAATRQRST